MNTDRETPLPPALTCDVGALTAPDLAVVDALARLRLAAARHGVRVRLENASGPLRELLAFSGLGCVLPVEDAGPPGSEPLDFGPPGSEPAGFRPVGSEPAGFRPVGRGLLGFEPGREAEEREEHVGVEEVGEPGDPAR
ncbi:STAS domain-containing protein [Kitasatospora sp. NPDC127111]|uniref:STAS domain-containing protein n=1 Tax=Kitasatospora sp. NPDC127111 TaxID=3345363 RepID=UPI0036383315